MRYGVNAVSAFSAACASARQIYYCVYLEEHGGQSCPEGVPINRIEDGYMFQTTA